MTNSLTSITEKYKGGMICGINTRLSAAVASMAAERIFLPIRRLYRHIYSFTQMDTARITRAMTLKSTAAGWRIFSTEDLARIHFPPGGRLHLSSNLGFATS